MHILAIETSGPDASLAALVGEADGAARLVEQRFVTGPQRTAQYLAPRMVELLRAVGWSAKSIGLVSVAIGPGSFTGLRIGVTTAKTLAYSLGSHVIGVNALDVIASQAPRCAAPLWVVIDAQRQELFAAKFVDAARVGEPAIVSQADWLKMLRSSDRVTGPGLQRLRARLPSDVNVIDEACWQPLAASVGTLAWRDYAAGRRDDVWKLLPLYYRPSAAEEKAAQLPM
jgi:tRNA threonylcarbamoyladenosine biosynthesis protein TsaB